MAILSRTRFWLAVTQDTDILRMFFFFFSPSNQVVYIFSSRSLSPCHETKPQNFSRKTAKKPPIVEVHHGLAHANTCLYVG